MTRRLFLSILITALLFPAVVLARKAEPGWKENPENYRSLIEKLADDPRNPELIIRLCHAFSISGEPEKAVGYALLLEEIGVEQDDAAILLAAYATIGQIYLATDRTDSARINLFRGLDIAGRLGDPGSNRRSLYTLYNALGVYYISAEMNYQKAIEYFYAGFRLAEEFSDTHDYGVLGSNLVTAYYLRNDPSGLEYALRIYEQGRATGNRYLIFSGSNTTALMYYIIGDYRNALSYIEQTVLLVDEFHDRSSIYSIYANILLALGREEEAAQNYLMALESVASASSMAASYTYLSYGEYLAAKGRYDESAGILGEGLRLSLETNNTVYRDRLYRNISAVYARLNEYRKALEYYIAYHEESDSIFNVERERSINELRVSYETEKREREIQEGKLRLARESRRLQAVLFILLIIVIILAAIYMLYRHKNRLYISILKQHQETLKKERLLEAELEQLRKQYGQNLPERGNTSSSVVDSKYADIFSRLEQLMRERFIYRERNLTVEQVAKMINTNRTYLSRSINEQTGLSFNYYINSYRIEEAVRTLSEPANDIPLKTLSYELGFNSLSTFYKLFQSVVGMPPSRYREKVMRPDS